MYSLCMSCCCCSTEPIPKSKETICAIFFWGAIVAFVLLYLILIDEAVEANKMHVKPANLGMVLTLSYQANQISNNSVEP